MSTTPFTRRISVDPALSLQETNEVTVRLLAPIIPTEGVDPSRRLTARVLDVVRKASIATMLLVICACAVAAQKDLSVDEQRARLAKADALFQERCKTAGEKIHRTVENVEGIFLMKIRPRGMNYGRQFDLDDPYGRDLGGDGYIESFTRGSFQANTTGTPAPGSPPRTGYLYVEALDAVDGKRYRYTGAIKEVGVKTSFIGGGDGKTYIQEKYVLDKVLASGQAPRYGVTYDDISTREDREHWIAGSSLKVVDLQTKEVIAERIGYMIDKGQGDTSGGRSPWLYAADNACPSFQRNPLRPLPRGQGAAAQKRQTQDFVEKVLKPKMVP